MKNSAAIDINAGNPVPQNLLSQIKQNEEILAEAHKRLAEVREKLQKLGYSDDWWR